MVNNKRHLNLILHCLIEYRSIVENAIDALSLDDNVGLDYLRLCNFFLRLLSKTSDQHTLTAQGKEVHTELLDAWKRLDQPLSVVLRNFITTHWESPHHELALDCVSLAREQGLCSTSDTNSLNEMHVIAVLNERLKPVRDAISIWRNHRK